MHNARPSADVIIIGAGIVGIATAFRLQQAGVNVLLLDRDPPARGASYGNAGALAVSEVIPLAEPGIWRQLPGWLMDPLGPLTIRWRQLPELTGWLLRFALASRKRRVDEYACQLAALLATVNEDFGALVTQADVARLWRRHGALAVYPDERRAQQDRARWQQRQALGVRCEWLSDDAIALQEPLLQPAWRQGVSIPDWSHVDDPYELAMGLLEAFRLRGGRFSQQGVTRIVHTQGRVSGVQLQDGQTLVAPQVVLAAGVWSRALAAPTGLNVPLASERGYHLTLPYAGKPLKKYLLNVPGSFVVLPMANGGIRLAGTVELASDTAVPDYRRSYQLLAQAEAMLGPLDTRAMSAWMGQRPSVPETVPVIGPSPNVSGLYLATGHGHLGLTLAATTARLLHDQIVLGQAIPDFLHPGRTPGTGVVPNRHLEMLEIRS